MLRRGLRSLQLRVLDAADQVSARTDALVPARRHNFVGDSDFVGTGDEFLGLFVELAGLRAGERVLDVGCGIGRMARPLAGYLGPSGSYEGFDVVPEGIEWCRDHYVSHPNFAFRLAEVENGLYRPDHGTPAAEYRFPYPDAHFDFGFATSVFTHLLPAEADRYLSEMARVTRPGGRLLTTFFLLRPGRDRPPAGSRFSFAHVHGDWASDSEETPEAAVAYTEDWLRERLARNGLTPREPIRYGTWNGRADGLSLQDIVVAERR